MRELVERFADFLYHVFRGNFQDPQYSHEIEGHGYIYLITPYTQTLANLPTPFIFAKEVNYVTIQNNSPSTLYYGLDEPAYPGTFALPANSFVWWAKRVRAVYFYTTATTPVNIFSTTGITLRGSL